MLSSIFKKAKKEDHDIYISVSFTSVPGKIMEMIIFRFIEKPLKGNAVTICKWKVLLISFYKKFLHLVDQVKTVDVICLNFTKTSDTVSQILSFLNKMSNL